MKHEGTEVVVVCENITIYFDPCNKKYFHISSQTVFSIDLLEDVTNNISISATTFQSRAEIYNRVSDAKKLTFLKKFGRSIQDIKHPWKLTEKRIEDAWLIYSLVCFFVERGNLEAINFNTVSAPAQRIDVDAICGEAWEIITGSSNPWIYHQCNVKGCSEGKLMRLETSSM